ncbi:hypothetical protein BJY04DRAFT_217587 [Aspergillus karnatakaensis]|uniref:uncharacterized protein n=1 Tax=Aspergillus karnatakaensis TaxID=1810916 RepID=UPI003CCC943D
MAPRTHFDLLGYNALEIEIAWADDRTYAIVMEDERAFGFEGQFRGATTAEREELKAKTQTDSGGEASDEPENKNTVEEESVKRIIRFDRLVPTRRDVGADTIRTLGERNVRGFGIIIRNTNDEQSGTFSLSIKAIYAIRLDCDCPHKYGPDLASRVPREEDISRIKLPSPVVEVKNPRSNKRARLSAAIRSARKSADELAVRLRASKAQPPRPE